MAGLAHEGELDLAMQKHILKLNGGGMKNKTYTLTRDIVLKAGSKFKPSLKVIERSEGYVPYDSHPPQDWGECQTGDFVIGENVIKVFPDIFQDDSVK